MAKFQENEINLQSINNGNRFEDGKPVPASAVNAPIEAAYYVQEKIKNVGQNYSVFGEVGGDSSVSIYAYMDYTRIGNGIGIFKLTCDIPQNSSSSHCAFSTSKINALFSSNHSINFSPKGQKAFSFMSDYTAQSSLDIVGYAPLVIFESEGIRIGRIYTTSGDFGSWDLSRLSGVFHTEITVSEA